MTTRIKIQSKSTGLFVAKDTLITENKYNVAMKNFNNTTDKDRIWSVDGDLSTHPKTVVYLDSDSFSSLLFWGKYDQNTIIVNGQAFNSLTAVGFGAIEVFQFNFEKVGESFNIGQYNIYIMANNQKLYLTCAASDPSKIFFSDGVSTTKTEQTFHVMYV